MVRLKKAQPDVFGSEVYGFRLNPPLSEAEAVAFERIWVFT
jgi:hypothetical protein